MLLTSSAIQSALFLSGAAYRGNNFLKHYYSSESSNLIIISALDSSVDAFITYEENSSTLFITIRGSLCSLSDWTGNLDTKLAQPTYSDGTHIPRTLPVHQGWLNISYDVINAVENFFGDNLKDVESVVVTGHSRGGAVAKILTLMWQTEIPNLLCVTFGAPPVAASGSLEGLGPKELQYNYDYLWEKIPNLEGKPKYFHFRTKQDRVPLVLPAITNGRYGVGSYITLPLPRPFINPHSIGAYKAALAYYDKTYHTP